MYFFKTSLLTSFALWAVGGSTDIPGYSIRTSSTVSNSSLSFGRHYAVLNLDLINAMVFAINETTAGQQWINCTASWIER